MFLLPLHMVGCSHQTSNPTTIGRLHLGSAVRDAWLQSLQRDGAPAVLLSTCHRTELYWSGDADLVPWFETHVLSRVDGPLHFEQREADLAVRHLFSVASGMCSTRYGEPEILRQVRSAWTAAQALDGTDALLDSVFRRAIEAARHIRGAIGTDADPSLGERVRALLLERSTTPVRVLVLGAGDAAQGVIDALAEASVRQRVQVALTSRSEANASRAAAAHGATLVPWEAKEQALSVADVAVFAIQTSTPLFDGAAASRLLESRSSRVLWIDLGVTPTVDRRALPPALDLVTLDTLAPASQRNVARDRRAHAALQRELARCARDAQRRRIGSRLPVLEAHAASVARAMVAASSDAWSPDAADVVARRVTRALLREIAELSI